MGEEQKNVFFLLSGIFRGFFVDINGREITDCFGYKKGTPIMSTFQFDMPSPVYIEASEYCEVLSVPIDKVLELLHENTSIVRVYNCMLQEALNKQWQTKVILYQYTAMQKYEWFLETYEEIVDKISNKNIASFLNITPVTLSRLRRKMREDSDREKNEMVKII